VRDSCSSSRTGESPQAQSAEEAHRPAESEHPGAENQQPNLTEPTIKNNYKFYMKYITTFKALNVVFLFSLLTLRIILPIMILVNENHYQRQRFT
jgi:hypothetical protein